MHHNLSAGRQTVVTLKSMYSREILLAKTISRDSKYFVGELLICYILNKLHNVCDVETKYANRVYSKV